MSHDAAVASSSEVLELYEELARRADASDWSVDSSDALSALLTQRTCTSLLTCRLQGLQTTARDGSYTTLARNGDVVLGFYMDA